MKRHLLWLRADLRSIDNTALHQACLNPEAAVAAVWFVTPEQWRRHDKAGVQLDLELRTLRELSATLATLNIPLLIRQASVFSELPDRLLALCHEEGIEAVYWNRQYEWNERCRDKAVAIRLKAQGIRAEAFHDQCLVEPGAVLTGDGRFYSVYTPFKKNWLQQIHARGVTVHPAPPPRHAAWTAPDPVPDSLDGFPSHVPLDVLARQWPGGESAALARLAAFMDGPPAAIGPSAIFRHWTGLPAPCRLIWRSAQFPRANAGRLPPMNFRHTARHRILITGSVNWVGGSSTNTS